MYQYDWQAIKDGVEELGYGAIRFALADPDGEAEPIDLQLLEVRVSEDEILILVEE